eukprot:GHVN01069291.1.p1 GENE.GHVN01069291.1~~GHVN01069291.1.p1  ORF type:complete len:2290 (-),score=269.58 GHVN01069291.1:23-6892(-)
MANPNVGALAMEGVGKLKSSNWNTVQEGLLNLLASRSTKDCGESGLVGYPVLEEYVKASPHCTEIFSLWQRLDELRAGEVLKSKRSQFVADGGQKTNVVLGLVFAVLSTVLRLSLLETRSRNVETRSYITRQVSSLRLKTFFHCFSVDVPVEVKRSALALLREVCYLSVTAASSFVNEFNFTQNDFLSLGEGPGRGRHAPHRGATKKLLGIFGDTSNLSDKQREYSRCRSLFTGLFLVLLTSPELGVVETVIRKSGFIHRVFRGLIKDEPDTVLHFLESWRNTTKVVDFRNKPKFLFSSNALGHIAYLLNEYTIHKLVLPDTCPKVNQGEGCERQQDCVANISSITESVVTSKELFNPGEEGTILSFLSRISYLHVPQQRLIINTLTSFPSLIPLYMEGFGVLNPPPPVPYAWYFSLSPASISVMPSSVAPAPPSRSFEWFSQASFVCRLLGGGLPHTGVQSVKGDGDCTLGDGLVISLVRQIVQLHWQGTLAIVSALRQQTQTGQTTETRVAKQERAEAEDVCTEPRAKKPRCEEGGGESHQSSPPSLDHMWVADLQHSIMHPFIKLDGVRKEQGCTVDHTQLMKLADALLTLVLPASPSSASKGSQRQGVVTKATLTTALLHSDLSVALSGLLVIQAVCQRLRVVCAALRREWASLFRHTPIGQDVVLGVVQAVVRVLRLRVKLKLPDMQTILSLRQKISTLPINPHNTTFESTEEFTHSLGLGLAVRLIKAPTEGTGSSHDERDGKDGAGDGDELADDLAGYDVGDDYLSASNDDGDEKEASDDGLDVCLTIKGDPMTEDSEDETNEMDSVHHVSAGGTREADGKVVKKKVEVTVHQALQLFFPRLFSLAESSCTGCGSGCQHFSEGGIFFTAWCLCLESLVFAMPASAVECSFDWSKLIASTVDGSSAESKNRKGLEQLEPTDLLHVMAELKSPIIFSSFTRLMSLGLSYVVEEACHQDSSGVGQLTMRPQKYRVDKARVSWLIYLIQVLGLARQRWLKGAAEYQSIIDCCQQLLLGYFRQSGIFETHLFDEAALWLPNLSGSLNPAYGPDGDSELEAAAGFAANFVLLLRNVSLDPIAVKVDHGLLKTTNGTQREKRKFRNEPSQQVSLFVQAMVQHVSFRQIEQDARRGKLLFIDGDVIQDVAQSILSLWDPSRKDVKWNENGGSLVATVVRRCLTEVATLAPQWQPSLHRLIILLRPWRNVFNPVSRPVADGDSEEAVDMTLDGGELKFIRKQLAKLVRKVEAVDPHNLKMTQVMNRDGGEMEGGANNYLHETTHTKYQVNEDRDMEWTTMRAEVEEIKKEDEDLNGLDIANMAGLTKAMLSCTQEELPRAVSLVLAAETQQFANQQAAAIADGKGPRIVMSVQPSFTKLIKRVTDWTTEQLETDAKSNMLGAWQCLLGGVHFCISRPDVQVQTSLLTAITKKMIPVIAASPLYAKLTQSLKWPLYGSSRKKRRKGTAGDTLKLVRDLFYVAYQAHAKNHQQQAARAEGETTDAIVPPLPGEVADAVIPQSVINFCQAHYCASLSTADRLLRSILLASSTSVSMNLAPWKPVILTSAKRRDASVSCSALHFEQSDARLDAVDPFAPVWFTQTVHEWAPRLIDFREKDVSGSSDNTCGESQEVVWRPRPEWAMFKLPRVRATLQANCSTTSHFFDCHEIGHTHGTLPVVSLPERISNVHSAKMDEYDLAYVVPFICGRLLVAACLVRWREKNSEARFAPRKRHPHRNTLSSAISSQEDEWLDSLGFSQEEEDDDDIGDRNGDQWRQMREWMSQIDEEGVWLRHIAAGGALQLMVTGLSSLDTVVSSCSLQGLAIYTHLLEMSVSGTSQQQDRLLQKSRTVAKKKLAAKRKEAAQGGDSADSYSDDETKRVKKVRHAFREAREILLLLESLRQTIKGPQYEGGRAETPPVSPVVTTLCSAAVPVLLNPGHTVYMTMMRFLMRPLGELDENDSLEPIAFDSNALAMFHQCFFSQQERSHRSERLWILKIVRRLVASFGGPAIQFIPSGTEDGRTAGLAWSALERQSVFRTLLETFNRWKPDFEIWCATIPCFIAATVIREDWDGGQVLLSESCKEGPHPNFTARVCHATHPYACVVSTYLCRQYSIPSWIQSQVVHVLQCFGKIENVTTLSLATLRCSGEKCTLPDGSIAIGGLQHTGRLSSLSFAPEGCLVLGVELLSATHAHKLAQASTALMLLVALTYNISKSLLYGARLQEVSGFDVKTWQTLSEVSRACNVIGGGLWVLWMCLRDSRSQIKMDSIPKIQGSEASTNVQSRIDGDDRLLRV